MRRYRSCWTYKYVTGDYVVPSCCGSNYIPKCTLNAVHGMEKTQASLPSSCIGRVQFKRHCSWTHIVRKQLLQCKSTTYSHGFNCLSYKINSYIVFSSQGMSFHLMVFGACYIVGALAIPSDMSNQFGNIGNVATCTAHGFLCKCKGDHTLLLQFF